MRFLQERAATVVMAAALLAIAAAGTVWLASLVAEVASPVTVAGHHDGLAFYAASTLVNRGDARAMYDPAAITAIERTVVNARVGAAGYMPFINPPFVAVLQAPLAAAGFAAMRTVWTLISALLALGAVILLTAPMRPGARLIACCALVLSFPVYQALVETQLSPLLLLGGALALVAFRRRHPAIAGAALGVLAVKPPLLLLVGIGLLLYRQWRAVVAMLGASLFISAVALPWTGTALYGRYAAYLASVAQAHVSGAGQAGATAWEGTVSGMQGLNGAATMLLGQSHYVAVDVITAGMAAAVIGVWLWAFWHRRRASQSTAAIVSLLCAGLLCDPHLYGQDCVLLFVPLAVILRSVHSTRLQLWSVIATVAAADAVALDTGTAWGPHLLTLTLLGVVIVTSARHGYSHAKDNALLSRQGAVA